MDTDLIRIVHTGNDESVICELSSFNSKNKKTFNFTHMDKESKQKLIKGILERLNSRATAKTYETCLETLRILSREKSNDHPLTSEHALKLLIRHSGLEAYAAENNDSHGNVTIQDGDYSVMVEALKCLCNTVFNYSEAQIICSNNGCVEGIIQRMKTYKDPELAFEIKYFDMRLLLLITILVPDTRLRIKTELHGVTYLMEVLDLALSRNTQLEDDDVNLICELLKILFNITMELDKNRLDEEEDAHYQRLVSILHDLLLARTATKDKAHELHQHTVNLLVNMPRSSYDELLTPVTEVCIPPAQSCNELNVEYDGKNMAAVVVLLRFLEGRLTEPTSSLAERLVPVLHCFCELCRDNRTIRKFCRIRILPPLRDDVIKLPEEGDRIRNKLVKLFTSVIIQVKDFAADLCFVLCKENVARFVKYTGYGNAAGLLAQRGLMCGGKAGEYSSDSDDSDTEEYSSLAAGVNPVTGRWEAETRNPMEGMSDEQKEYEAMKLVNQFDKLNRAGLVQPVVIGADGKPQVIEHVQQLVQGMGAAGGVHDSDSD